jgi:glycosyltransferase involved in cell wall biosynthesis
LAECLDSVFAQTYDNIEVICIDNNSTDDTYQLLEKLKQKFPTLIIDKETMPGAPAARNKGLSLAKGEWIQFLDADDLLLPNKIEHQIDLLQHHDIQVPFVAAACLLQDITQKQRVKKEEEDTWKALFTTRLGNTCANLFRRTHLQESGGWNTKLQSSQEYELMFRLVQSYGAPLIDSEPLTIIRERASGQISQRNPKEKWKQYIQLRVDMISYLKSDLSVYFKLNESWFNQELFKAIRFLFPYDSKEAIKIYNENLPLNFYPQTSVVNSTFYCTIFRILGFKKAEQLKYIFKKIKFSK